MSEAVVVGGVGMVPFGKPGASEPYNVMGANAVRAALADAGITYDQVEQAYVGLRVRRFHVRSAGALRGWHDRYSDRQRQQQLLDGFDGAVPRAAGRGQRRDGLRTCARLRADGSGRARREIQGPSDTLRALRCGDRRLDRPPGSAAGNPLFWRSGPRAHAEVRHTHGNVREDPRQGEPACVEQSAGALPKDRHARRGHGDAGVDAGSHDALDGMPSDLRGGSGDRGIGRFRAAALALPATSASSRRR